MNPPDNCPKCGAYASWVARRIDDVVRYICGYCGRDLRDAIRDGKRDDDAYAKQNVGA